MKRIPGALRTRIRQAGVSLVELALALAGLGVIALLVLQHGADSMRRQSDLQSRQLLERAQAATLAFAFMNARLPCPATDSGGLESCETGVQGYLPYRTLGLPDAAAGVMLYRLDSPRLARPGAVFEVLAPAVRSDDRSLMAEALPLQSVAGAGTDQTLDFCAVLGHSGEAQAPPPIDVAFELRAQAESLFVRRSMIASELACAGLLSTAGRAHFNAGLQAAVARRALTDYGTQFDIARGLYEWDFAQSNWFVANSVYSSSKIAIKLHVARASWFASLQANPEPATAMALAASALALSSLHTAVYASNVARGAANLAAARLSRQRLDELMAKAEALEQRVAGHAVASSSSLLFLSQQDWDGEQAQVYLKTLAKRLPLLPAEADFEQGLGEEARDYLRSIQRL